MAEGTHVFGSAENAIADTAEAWRCNLKAAAPNAFKGAKIYLGYTQFEINANVYLQGNDQEIDRFTAPNPANAWSIKVDMRPNGTYGGGRISGGGTGGKVPRLAMKATGNCYYVGMIQDDLQLVWAPQGDYTFVVSNRSQKMTSPVIVSNGTFAVEGGTVVFPNVTGFKVAAGARLRVGTTNAMPFPSMTSLDLDENARLICKDAGASGLSTVKLNVRLAEGAKIAVEANKVLVLKTLVKAAGDVPIGIGTYTGGEGSALVRHADWIDGDGQVVVLSVPGMEIKTSTWKGGGANDNLSTPENWTGEQAPSLQDGSARLELVESGSHVTVDQPALVNGIVDILGAEKSVTVDGEELQLLGGGIDSTNTVFSSNRSMVFDNDIALMAPQTWKPYGSLTFNGSIRSMSGKETLTINGPGVVNLTGTNTFAGPVIIDSGELRLSSEESLGDSSEPLTLNGKETRKPCLMLNGAHVKRPVSLANDHEYEFALRSKPGTINVLAKPVTLGSTVNRMYLDARSTVVFEGGLTGWLFDPSSADDCSAWLIFRKTPLNETFLYMDGGGNVAFEVAGNKLSDNAFLCPWNGMKRLLVETRVENAFTTNCQIKMYGKTSAISANWDLCGFDQQCGRLVGGGGHFFVRSTKPASLTIYQTTITTNAVVFQGAASLVKEGAATLELSGASTSTGSVTVARGTLKFRTGSDWKHGQRRRFRNDFTIRAGAKLALESGVAITVRELYLPTGPDGALEKQETGTWGSSSSGATRKNDTYFAGEGVLNVIGTNVGLTVLIR